MDVVVLMFSWGLENCVKIEQFAAALALALAVRGYALRFFIGCRYLMLIQKLGDDVDG